MLLFSKRLTAGFIPPKSEQSPYSRSDIYIDPKLFREVKTYTHYYGTWTHTNFNVTPTTGNRCYFAMLDVPLAADIGAPEQGEMLPGYSGMVESFGETFRYWTKFVQWKTTYDNIYNTDAERARYLRYLYSDSVVLIDFDEYRENIFDTMALRDDQGYTLTNWGLYDPQGNMISRRYATGSEDMLDHIVIETENVDGSGNAVDLRRMNGHSYFTELPIPGAIYNYYVSYWDNGGTTSFQFDNVAPVGGTVIYTTAQSKQNFLTWVNGFDRIDDSEYTPDTDPYSEVGQAGEGGGNGDVDNVSEPVDIPDLPTISATDTGLVSLFAPTALQLKSLANYLWSGAFDLDSFKKIFADPMDCILGLSLLPVAINSQTQRVLSVGNISTGITMDFVESQYVKIDCGSLNINEYFGAYLDYSPYTKIEIYLPYIGIRPLAIDDVMNKTLQVVYHIDLLSGTCTAFLKADDSVIYSYIGQCSVEIPVTSVNYGNMITGALNIAGSIGSMVATGGMSAPMALGNIAATATNSLKPDVEKSGAYSGGGGLLGIQNPYVILTRPRAAIPANQNKYLGYPGFITKKVSNLSGYTEFEEIHLEGLTATENEMSELMNILKNGVIL